MCYTLVMMQEGISHPIPRGEGGDNQHNGGYHDTQRSCNQVWRSRGCEDCRGLRKAEGCGNGPENRKGRGASRVQSVESQAREVSTQSPPRSSGGDFFALSLLGFLPLGMGGEGGTL